MAEWLAALQVVAALLLMFGLPAHALGGLTPMETSGWAAVAGSLVGVVLGAILGAIFQWLFQRQQARDARLALGYSVFHKVKRYADTIGQVCRLVLEAETQREGRALWLALPPLSPVHPEIAEFTPSELALFSARGGIDFADELSDFESLHNVLVQLMLDYSNRRDALERIVEQGGVLSMEGTTGTIGSEILDRYPVQVAKLEQMALHLLRVCSEGAGYCESVADRVGPRLKQHLGDERFSISLQRRAAPGSAAATAEH